MSRPTPSLQHSSAASAMSRSRAVTAAGDMSTPRGIREEPVALSSLIARRRWTTLSGVMLTTGDLLQALDVHDVLRPARSQLEGDQAFARDDPQCARRLARPGELDPDP